MKVIEEEDISNLVSITNEKYVVILLNIEL